MARNRRYRRLRLCSAVWGAGLLVLVGLGVINLVTTGNTLWIIPTPAVGQWVDFGRTEPRINGNQFTFPTDTSATAGYFYTKPVGAVAPNMTVTLNYTVTGSSDFQQTPQSGQPSDVNPATISLFIWRQGDDLSCNGAFASYRMWAAKRNLVIGANQVIGAPLISNNWTNCYGQHGPTGFLGTLQNLLGIGFTFGGQNFNGHGVYNPRGAGFIIEDFTVK
jgi:hypothetical protein